MDGGDPPAKKRRGRRPGSRGQGAYRGPDQLDAERDCGVSFVVTGGSPGGRVTERWQTLAEEAAEARRQADASAAAAAPPPAGAGAGAGAQGWEEEEENEEQAAPASGKHLSAAERIRNRRFKVRFKKLRAHKQRRVLHAVVSLYPDGKVLTDGDYALTSVLEQPTVRAQLQRAAAALRKRRRTFRNSATSFADASLSHNQRQQFAALMCRKLREAGEQGSFPKKPAGEPAGEPAEKPADWAERLRGPGGERLGLVVPFEQPAHIPATALCLEGSGGSSSRGPPKRMPVLCNALATWAGVILEGEELANLPACAPFYTSFSPSLCVSELAAKCACRCNCGRVCCHTVECAWIALQVPRED